MKLILSLLTAVTLATFSVKAQNTIYLPKAGDLLSANGAQTLTPGVPGTASFLFLTNQAQFRVAPKSGIAIYPYFLLPAGSTNANVTLNIGLGVGTNAFPKGAYGATLPQGSTLLSSTQNTNLSINITLNQTNAQGQIFGCGIIPASAIDGAITFGLYSIQNAATNVAPILTNCFWSTIGPTP